MKVVENNFKNSVEVECDNCNSVLEIEHADLKEELIDEKPILNHVICECCGEKIYVDPKIFTGNDEQPTPRIDWFLFVEPLKKLEVIDEKFDGDMDDVKSHIKDLITKDDEILSEKVNEKLKGHLIDLFSTLERLCQ